MPTSATVTGGFASGFEYKSAIHGDYDPSIGCWQKITALELAGAQHDGYLTRLLDQDRLGLVQHSGSISGN
jgi:hypothetical protein